MSIHSSKALLSPDKRVPGIGFLDEAATWFNRETQTIDPEAGDVPGWVMVTLMTAGLVVAIFAVASPALVGLFNRAISSVNIP